MSSEPSVCTAVNRPASAHSQIQGWVDPGGIPAARGCGGDGRAINKSGQQPVGGRVSTR